MVYIRITCDEQITVSIRDEGVGISEEEQNMEGVKMTAIVKNIGEKIEVEVVEGEYDASGIYWVNVSDETVYTA